jgi:hypothetical protein
MHALATKEGVEGELARLDEKRDTALATAKAVYLNHRAEIRAWYFRQRRKLRRLLEAILEEEPPELRLSEDADA